jgi:hypothetical protein
MTWSPIVELRQYTLVPGKRDVLVDLFDADLIEGQEDTGMKIIGQFCDLDDPDKFVLRVPADARIVEFFEDEIAPGLADIAAYTLAYLVSEPSENTFPSLPVREGENVFVWFAGFADRESYGASHRERIEIMNAARSAPGIALPPHVLRLAPTSSSLLAGSSKT